MIFLHALNIFSKPIVYCIIDFFITSYAESDVDIISESEMYVCSGSNI